MTANPRAPAVSVIEIAAGYRHAAVGTQSVRGILRLLGTFSLIAVQKAIMIAAWV
jgi:hypothetical protein